MNIKSKIKKLQTALIHEGLVLKINQTQFFSEEQQRTITIYRLVTPITYMKKDGTWGNKDYEILKTCSNVDVVLCLVDIYMEVRHDT